MVFEGLYENKFLKPFLIDPRQSVKEQLKTEAKIASVVIPTATAVLAPEFAVPIIKTIAKNPIKSGLALLGGLTILKSEKAKEQIVNLPSAIDTLTTDTAKLYDNPSPEGLKELAKEHPFAVGAVGAGAVGALGYGAFKIIPVVSNFLNTQAIKENTREMQKDIVVSPSNPIAFGEKTGDKQTTANPEPTLSPASISQPNVLVPADKGIMATTKRRKKVKKVTEIRNIFKPQIQLVQVNG